MYSYKPTGVCAKLIEFEIEGTTLKNLSFTSGCPGNLKGIANLVQGMEIDEVITRLKGITCGRKTTSCPDQLTNALEDVKAGNLQEGSDQPKLKMAM